MDRCFFQWHENKICLAPTTCISPCCVCVVESKGLRPFYLILEIDSANTFVLFINPSLFAMKIKLNEIEKKRKIKLFNLTVCVFTFSNIEESRFVCLQDKLKVGISTKHEELKGYQYSMFFLIHRKIMAIFVII